jgi:flagellar motor component MotA
MTVIATNFIILPFAHQLLNAFKEYSNEYEFITEGVFRRIIPTACPQCGKAMSHNGFNI